MKLHIIYTESAMLLSKTEYATWQDVQRDFPGYKASLGPWPDAEVVEYLDEEYPDIFPGAHTQVAELRESESAFSVVRFLK
ncbi:hypothetical protein LPN04_14755 [Rugamonas sp. A1-17]|nr:hypothetical protein [Rugamonas sp. A1-17]